MLAFYIENYKTLLRENEDLNKWDTLLMNEKTVFVKMPILFSVNP